MTATNPSTAATVAQVRFIEGLARDLTWSCATLDWITGRDYGCRHELLDRTQASELIGHMKAIKDGMETR